MPEPRVIESAAAMAQFCREAPRPLGLVPTMGALHEGHLSLVRRARAESRTLAVTIFVNPTQFGPQEDLARYPRNLARDLALLAGEKVDLVYAPAVEQVYPPGFVTRVEVAGLGEKLEGASRPGHFRGVATVVTKLFCLIRPDRAYFGQKDGQQTVIIKRLVRDLDLGVTVEVAPTVREPDGLALSSRNVYLTPEQRRAAPALYAALRRGEELWRGGNQDGEDLRQQVRRALQGEPLIGPVHYVSLADTETLEELVLVRAPAMLSAAVNLGETRLIDNIMLE